MGEAGRARRLTFMQRFYRDLDLEVHCQRLVVNGSPFAFLFTALFLSLSPSLPLFSHAHIASTLVALAPRLFVGLHWSVCLLQVSLRGAVLTLVESTAGGSVELCAFTVDLLTLRKAGASDATRATVHHVQASHEPVLEHPSRRPFLLCIDLPVFFSSPVFLCCASPPAPRCVPARSQVDDMRPTAGMPVVFQPMDSGFNSHVRDDGRRDVPFVQVSPHATAPRVALKRRS
jgi:hypothetical protein